MDINAVDSCAMKYKDGSPWNDVEEGLEPEEQTQQRSHQSAFRQVMAGTYSGAEHIRMSCRHSVLTVMFAVIVNVYKLII